MQSKVRLSRGLLLISFIFAMMKCSFTDINLPELPVKVREENGLQKIFDPVRKKWLGLTPEEWVRQNWVLYLHHFLHFPLGLMETEKFLKLNNTVKRADIVLYNQKLKPVMIVECKGPEVPLGKKTIEQAGMYHMVLGVKFLVVTNGIRHHAIKLADGKAEFTDKIPDFNALDD